MRHRRATAVGFVIVTAIFAMGIRNVQIQTILSDLLPEDDPFVQVYKDHPNFGNPLTVTLMVKHRSGD
jgi:predicted RND superfamily exporter protein